MSKTDDEHLNRTAEQASPTARICEKPSCHSQKRVRLVEGADGEQLTLCRYHTKQYLGVSS